MSQTESERESLHAAAGAAEPLPQSAQQDVPAAQKWMLVATESLGLFKSTVDLLLLELLAAAKAVPKLVALSFGLIFFLSLAWISFSVCLSWVAVHFSGEVGAGIFCFFFVQLATIMLVLMLMKRCKRALTLPNTRQQAKEIAEIFNEAFKANQAQEDGGHR